MPNEWTLNHSIKVKWSCLHTSVSGPGNTGFPFSSACLCGFVLCVFLLYCLLPMPIEHCILCLPEACLTCLPCSQCILWASHMWEQSSATWTSLGNILTTKLPAKLFPTSHTWMTKEVHCCQFEHMRNCHQIGKLSSEGSVSCEGKLCLKTYLSYTSGFTTRLDCTYFTGASLGT